MRSRIIPEAVNQSVRLEILNVLALMKYEKAQAAMKNFLKQQRSDVLTQMSAALMLTEGDEEAVELVKGCCRMRTARCGCRRPSFWHYGAAKKQVIHFLEESYKTAGREEKEKILEGLATIGSPSSISFFLQVLKEPYPILRLIGAYGVVSCLNH